MSNPFKRLQQIANGGPVVFAWRQIKGLFTPRERLLKNMCIEIAEEYDVPLNRDDSAMDMADALTTAALIKSKDRSRDELFDLLGAMGTRFIRASRLWGLWYLFWCFGLPILIAQDFLRGSLQESGSIGAGEIIVSLIMLGIFAVVFFVVQLVGSVILMLIGHLRRGGESPYAVWGREQE